MKTYEVTDSLQDNNFLYVYPYNENTIIFYMFTPITRTLVTGNFKMLVWKESIFVNIR